MRQKYSWRGYIHLKLLPNAEEAQIERAALLADRLSVNLEAPNEARLARLAPKKDFDHGLMEPLQRAWAIVRRLRNAGPCRGQRRRGHPVRGRPGRRERPGAAGGQPAALPPGGAAPRLLLGLQPHRRHPVAGGAPTPPLREHRLYQADFMLRQYGFASKSCPLISQGNLPNDRDPKLAWADTTP